MSKRLFISHSTKDDAQVDGIADALEKAGFTVWVDHRHGIEPGTPNWDQAIRKAIVEADAGIFLMSENSLSSEICGAECLLVRELEDPLYVMRLEACKPENIWLFIKQIQYADLVKDFDKGINDLIRVLGGETSEELPKAVRAAFTGLDTMRLYLPYLNNPLRGRDEDIKQIQSKLGGHILQIVGPGGLGKSRLAAEIAMNQPNGAVWHRCSTVSEPADLVALLREHLKLPADASLTNVLAVLSEKKPLIVVDNAEDVPDSSEKRRAYADLLQRIASRGVPVLLTTRVVWIDLKPRREYAPAAVLLETATQIALDFAMAEDVALSESQARDLAEKARFHPRLIEFAVGQIHERGLDSVLRQLSELKHADIKEALDEMITKTVEQMAAQAKYGVDAKALLHHMTILQATFPLDAIKAIAPDEMKEDADHLEDALVALQRWQFVRRDTDTNWYSLAELVREALGRPEERVFWHHAKYYTSRADEIFQLSIEHWKDHDHDLPNILALGDALVERISQLTLPKEKLDETEEMVVTCVLIFARNAAKFVTTRLEHSRMSWLDMGLKAAQMLNLPEYEAHFVYQLGLGWYGLGATKKALEYSNRALLLLEKLSDPYGQAAAANTIGTLWSALGKKQTALSYFERALSFWHALDNRPDKATVLNNLGKIWADLGNQERSLEYYAQALELYQAFNHQQGISTVLNNIGGIVDESGNKEQALGIYQQALSIFQSIGDRRGEATALNNIGLILSHLKEYNMALDIFRQVLPITQAMGDLDIEATTLNCIGTALFNLGQEQEALEYLSRSLELRHAIGDTNGEAITCFNIGTIYYALDYFDQALMFVERCINLEEENKHPHLEIARQTLQQLISKRDEARGS